MSRIIIPETFLEQQALFNKILAKDTADGSSSVIRPYMDENDIVLSEDETAAGDAADHEALRKEYTGKKENQRQLRDINFKTVFDNMKSGAQYLKKLYGKAYSKLAAWGFSVTVNGRIIYPADVAEQIALFNLYYAKHLSFTTPPSPLVPFLTANEIDITTDNTRATAAATNNTNFKSFAMQSEDQTELRNNFWNPVIANVTGIGQFLIKLYEKNPKALGDWGFVVDSSPQKPKERTSKLIAGATGTFTGIIVGGTFTNLGTTDLQVYQGKSTSGTPTTVNPGEKLGMIKGYSNITVVNTSSLNTGIFKVLAAR